MKKTLALAFCAAIASSVCAQGPATGCLVKNWKEKKGLAEVPQDAKSLYTAGKAEIDAYNKAFMAQQINPDAVDAKKMGEQLINGYCYWMEAMPLDSLPDAKGKIKPKYSKDIVNKLVGHVNDFFNVGGNFYNNKLYYPEAYQAFMIYADMPSIPAFAKSAEQVNESQRATAYFNAGLAAYTGSSVAESADAFRKARLCNYEQPEAYIYEIACWQNMMQKDSTLEAKAQKNINDIALAGFEKFGVAQPVFLNNIVNSMINDKKYDDALALINKNIAENPDNANLCGLLGFVYDRMDNDAESVKAYRAAAAKESADYETLLNAAKKIFRTGTEIWNGIEGNSAVRM